MPSGTTTAVRSADILNPAQRNGAVSREDREIEEGLNQRFQAKRVSTQRPNQTTGMKRMR